MNTLAQLKRGELAGVTRLKLSEQLETFPSEIFDLADSLEVLDLSGNRLSHLPSDLRRLHKLRILFCSNNLFTEVPVGLGKCPELEMIGLKANRIRRLPAEALPPALRWLILTDNRLESVPDEIGRCTRLQKLMLAGNQLQTLPETLSHCSRLELLRIAANRLPALPDWLLAMPRLTWLAFAGNPFSDAIEADALAQHPQPPIDRSQIALGEMLGQGASGIIHSANWQRAGQAPRTMAAKLFKGTLTSDGLPHSEMAACIAAGEHRNLIGIAGPLEERAEEPSGLLMELIDPSYQVLAGPPSFASCTRDCYEQERRFSVGQVLRIATGVASAVSHLHQHGILHGDLYAHNLLVDPAGRALLSDFGAASFYPPQSEQGQALQRLEARAFGCLLEELLERCDLTDDEPDLARLCKIQRQCMLDDPAQRPAFSELTRELETIGQASPVTAG
ncbi:leucine-rich repeat-containing protein kinase family protein [Pseudomonas sp. SST3]|uniref:leucine-rich repeat-containing protein kinase family protein n=1 Tax=Pseudomonas sp. SST3 TaxID=2267882 RepID=UPI000E04EE25|nr:leucine-rich repeat-containing protein kinase family protein [Pseudomonas sp. SST3]NKQ10540.1 protein kinase [Pseudomonas sp. SST3]